MKYTNCHWTPAPLCSVHLNKIKLAQPERGCRSVFSPAKWRARLYNRYYIQMALAYYLLFHCELAAAARGYALNIGQTFLSAAQINLLRGVEYGSGYFKVVAEWERIFYHCFIFSANRPHVNIFTFPKKKHFPKKTEHICCVYLKAYISPFTYRFWSMLKKMSSVFFVRRMPINVYV